MTIPNLNVRALVTRRITKLGDRTLDIMDTDFIGSRFMCSLVPPTAAPNNDVSPRRSRPHILRWRTGLVGPVEVPQAGWRLSLTRPVGRRAYENAVYELLNDPREERVGPSSMGMTAEAMSLGELYPYTASLRAQDGTVLAADVIVALWSEREVQGDRGTYEEHSGEAPAEYGTLLTNKTHLVIDGLRYNITSSTVDYENPRVRFDARRANA